MLEIDPEELYDTLAIVVAIILSGLTTLFFIPYIIKKMKERGIVGRDWNKKIEKEIPELGGIAVLFGFPIGISIATGLLKLLSSIDATLILASIGVLYIAGMIGIIDDISDIPKRVKAIALLFAALPLMIIAMGDEIIDFPFGLSLDFTQSHLFYWLIIVPIAITGAANAMNMSAGYNGLETGQISIIAFFLLSSAIINQSNIHSILIFATLLGAAIGLNHYNGFPALIFVGDVGTLGMGAVIGAGAIIGGLEFVGLVAIAPALYEGVATTYYSFIKRIDRKKACMKPLIDDEGKLHSPKGAERYTLAFFILSKKPMTEQELVRTILYLYIISGIAAVILTLL